MESVLRVFCMSCVVLGSVTLAVISYFKVSHSSSIVCSCLCCVACCVAFRVACCVLLGCVLLLRVAYWFVLVLWCCVVLRCVALCCVALRVVCCVLYLKVAQTTNATNASKRYNSSVSLWVDGTSSFLCFPYFFSRIIPPRNMTQHHAT